jgi:hypothetical protein
MGNLAPADSLYGIPSLPSILSHASGMMGSGPWDLQTLSSLGSLARGESTLAHLLSGTWPLEDDYNRNPADGGEKCH